MLVMVRSFSCARIDPLISERTAATLTGCFAPVVEEAQPERSAMESKMERMLPESHESRRRCTSVCNKNALSHASHASRDRLRHGATADHLGAIAIRSDREQSALDKSSQRGACSLAIDRRRRELHG